MYKVRTSQGEMLFEDYQTAKVVGKVEEVNFFPEGVYPDEAVAQKVLGGKIHPAKPRSKYLYLCAEIGDFTAWTQLKREKGRLVHRDREWVLGGNLAAQGGNL